MIIFKLKPIGFQIHKQKKRSYFYIESVQIAAEELKKAKHENFLNRYWNDNVELLKFWINQLLIIKSKTQDDVHLFFSQNAFKVTNENKAKILIV